MERPALQQLLAEIQAGRLDIVVVYKVDRLTRSLADFAKIVEISTPRAHQRRKSCSITVRPHVGDRRTAVPTS